MTQRLSEQITIPDQNRRASVKDEEGQMLAELVRESEYSRSLEVGFAWGLSAAYIMSAHEGEHVCMDPFQRNEFDDQGIKNIEQLGFGERLVFHRDYSHNVLPRLLADEQKFDFIFIDGDHRYDRIFVDFFYADLLLSEGGTVVFHDMWMRGSQLVTSFIKTNRKDYERVRVPIRNLGAAKKKGTDDRNWCHFKEFYNVKGMLRHTLFNWNYGRGGEAGLKTDIAWELDSNEET